ncbi:MAG TPA: bifunctional phosphoribosylaminoimidazolecarboxamide formyltransferase/IMP cyclohydrolase [Holophaga sp.]|nr:bifunctional phosphoribosylaminoimidazolecarboxamide formyltransferase/IMP cyclohydrolase [Holophaga sp.]HPS68211.1 bifunctional phosphoribosylaminoimidazolecarboxamide formyltransferase/IMP cyclohydrolase [Holophaga sp.]
MATALFSVYDKTGLLPLAKGLREMGWSLLATGGTLKALREGGLEVQEVADYTGAPECFDGRVKTLHPRIHGGLLFRRDEESHVADAARLGISPIDLVVVNLYPFEATIAKPRVGFAECIEQIDIGGPSMVRSAAKNHAAVTVLTDPAQYDAFLEKQKAGTWDLEDRRACALAAFQRTAAYDAAISTWMAGQVGQEAEGLPERLGIGLVSRQGLRYGENPHQAAAFYVQPGAKTEGIAACEQLQGKELSFNNLLDADGAARTVFQFAAPSCVIVKHNNPCGVGRGPHALEAFLKAQAGDPVSAFGGIAAFNRPIGPEVAQAMVQSFWEVVLAPGFALEALDIFAAKKNLRLLRTPATWPLSANGLDLRSIAGGFLVQRPDDKFAAVDQWEVKASGHGPKPLQEDLVLAQTVAKAVKSNSIVLVKDGGTVGIGAGQMSRVDSVEIACRKAGERAKGAILGSDAYFPFADGLELAARHGVTTFIEPGGSIRDKEVIEAAQKLGVWLFFTGMRHFRH